MSGPLCLLAYLVLLIALAYRGAGLKATAAVGALLLLACLLVGGDSPFSILVLLVMTGVTGLLCLDDLRRERITRPVFDWYRRVMPPISATEQEGIDAGTVWWEGELFTGTPDWNRLLGPGRPRLDPEEQAFIDGPLEQLCSMVDSWKINHEWAEIPERVRAFIHRHGFLGLIIPRRYGGLEFSAVAQSEIITRLFGVSTVVGNYILVPNSLGPAELLLKYGTEQQREHYLPRLASGAELPCFALTSPTAGSDATSITDTGVVCRGTWRGEEITGMRLSFDKRYITLAPVATLIGLAFRLQDPDHLLGEVGDYGITCALLPADTPGIDTGRRHLPIGDPFLNGPVRGSDVFVPLDCIIGGPAMAGKGWRMLVNCLSAGRSISLPSVSNCLAKRCAAAAGAYARVRRQFNLPLSRFEGIQKPLARIAGFSHIINAARLHTAQAVDTGSKPAVASSILKYHCTELARQAGIDTMDIHGGKAIMKGPSNYLSWGYESMPVAITVEGANIMTRSLMIFGQGATRCHPYVLREMELSRREPDADTIREFDRVLFAHIGFACANAARALVHGLSGSRFAAPLIDSPVQRYYRHINRFSAALALAADAAMLIMQGSLKRREMISARLGDLLSMLYLASMVLKHHEDEGCPEADRPLVDWSCRYLLSRYQEAMHGLLRNFPSRPVSWLLELLIFPLGGRFEPPADRLDTRLAELISSDSETRRRLIRGIYLAPGPTNPLGELNQLLLMADAQAPAAERVRKADRAGKLHYQAGQDPIDAAEAAGILGREEAAGLREYEERVWAIIQVDDFPAGALARKPPPPPRRKTVMKKRATARKKSGETGDRRSPRATGKSAT